MINAREIDGVPTPTDIILKVFNHAHTFYSIGLRMYFLSIPAFAWVFNEWSLLGVTPIYLFIIHSK